MVDVKSPARRVSSYRLWLKRIPATATVFLAMHGGCSVQRCLHLLLHQVSSLLNTRCDPVPTSFGDTGDPLGAYRTLRGNNRLITTDWLLSPCWFRIVEPRPALAPWRYLCSTEGSLGHRRARSGRELCSFSRSTTSRSPRVLLLGATYRQISTSHGDA